jgi:hypothetical protein
VAVGVLLAVVAAARPAAAAQATVEVGLGGGYLVPGRPVPVRRREPLRSASIGGDLDVAPYFEAVVRFDLPVGTDPAAPRAAVPTELVQEVEVWEGSGWTALPICGGATEPAAEPEEGPPCRLPPGAVADGSVVVRVTLFEDLTLAWPDLTQRAAA